MNKSYVNGLPFKVQVCEYLPKTIKDKDGNEVELIGVMVEDRPFDMSSPPHMVFMTGEIVKPAQREKGE